MPLGVEEKGSKSPATLRGSKEELPPMPSAEEVNNLFTTLMVTLNLPNDMRGAMMEMPTKKKWDYICKNSNKIDLSLKPRETGKVMDTPQFYVNTLKVEPTVQLLSSLCVTLRSQPSSWVKAFIDLEGISLLVAIIHDIEKRPKRGDSEQNLISETVYCLKAIMNTRVGLMGVLATDNAISRLTLCLDTPHLPSRLVVLELITTVALVDLEGYRMVLDAFTHYKASKREKTRFSHLTDSLRQAVDPEYITICLALINALVNSPEDIDDRVSLRNEFLRLGIDVVLATLKGSFHVEDEPDLHTQVDVFEEEMAADKDELMDRFAGLDVDLENPDDVFSAVKKQVFESERGLDSPLLTILQSLLSIPTESEAGYVCYTS